VDETIGLHVAPYRDREQSRRAHRPIGLLELARKAGGRHGIAGAANAGAAALAMRDQYRVAEARGDRRGGVADMDHERTAADRGAVACDEEPVEGPVLCLGTLDLEKP
jgi:hypothetical protein